MALPPLPMDGGDRNRTSPFAFTGNRFEFRAVGSSMSLAFTNTVLNAITAEAIDELAEKLEAANTGDLNAAVISVVKDAYSANKEICFDGDGYSDEWQEEAARRGLKNLKTTVDALPEVISPTTVETFEKYNVLSERELEARYEVWVEQYAIGANIEAETASNIARTMIIPAVAKHLVLLGNAEAGALETESRELFDELIEAFQPKYFHVGMDEVMLFPDATTPHYNGESPAEVFAKAANDYHDYLVKQKGLTMLMWGDRLIDRSKIRYNWMESSSNGTAPAIDMIPKDIIVCDWHYNRMPDYPSIGFFQEKGFRVWPATWKSPSAAMALLDSAKRQAQGDRMLGYMCTTWCDPGDFARAILGESENDEPSVAKRVAETFRVISEQW